MADIDNNIFDPPSDLKEDVFIPPIIKPKIKTSPSNARQPIFTIEDNSPVVEVNTTSVSATLTLTNGTQTISYGPVTKFIQSESINFEPLETLKDEFDQLRASGQPLVIDCQNRHFISTIDRSGISMEDYEFDFDPSNSDPHKDVTIKNGNFYGGFRPDWSLATPQTIAKYGTGVYEAFFDYTLNDPRPGGELKNIDPTRRFMWCPNEISPKIPSFPPSIYDIDNPANAGITDGPYHDYQFGRTERFILTQKFSDGTRNVEASGYLGLENGERAFIDEFGNPLTWIVSASQDTTPDQISRVIKTIVITDPNVIAQIITHYDQEIGYFDESENPDPYINRFFINAVTYANTTVIIPIVQLKYENGHLIFTIEGENEINEQSYLQAGYFEYAINGLLRPLNSGQWLMVPEEQRIYWKPRNGSPTGNEVVGIGLQKLFDFYSSVNENKTPYVWPDTVDDRPNGSWLVTFENCNFRVTGGDFIEMNAGSKYHLIHLKSCSFTYCDCACSRGISKIEDCYFDNCLSACCNVSDGSIIRRNWWGQSYDKSCFNASCGDYSNRKVGRREDRVADLLDGVSVIPLKTIVEQNVFYTPSTQHGQGVSFYKNTFMNAVFSNNLIVNTSRAWTNGLDEVNLDNPDANNYDNVINVADQMECNNNLFYANDFVSNIQGFVYNWEVGLRYWAGSGFTIGDESTHYQPGQMITTFKNNTVFVDRTDQKEASCGCGSNSKITNVQYGFQDNMWGKLIIAESGEQTGTAGGSLQGSLVAVSCVNNSYSNQNTANNLRGWGGRDNVAPPSLDDYYNCYVDRNTLQPLGVNQTNASDGGKVGVRWQKIPTVEEIWKIIRREDDFREPWVTHMVPLELAADAFDFTDSLTYVDRDTYTGSNGTLCHAIEYSPVESTCS